MIQSFLITIFWHDLHQGNILLSTSTTLMLIFYSLSLFEFRLGLNWAGSKKAVCKFRCNNRSPSTWQLFAIRKVFPICFNAKGLLWTPGGLLRSIFAGYMPQTSQSPSPHSGVQVMCSYPNFVASYWHHINPFFNRKFFPRPAIRGRTNHDS